MKAGGEGQISRSKAAKTHDLLLPSFLRIPDSPCILFIGMHFAPWMVWALY
jgi:hypothetical protein